MKLPWYRERWAELRSSTQKKALRHPPIDTDPQGDGYEEQKENVAAKASSNVQCRQDKEERIEAAIHEDVCRVVEAWSKEGVHDRLDEAGA